jgi:mRNA-degrading endonuclease RelE of RelBE toxin-antitoxin system
MPIELTQHFISQYKKLPAEIRLKINKALLSLVEADFRQLGQSSHRIEGAPGIYEFDIDVQYRLTFERRSDTYILRNVDATQA